MHYSSINTTWVLVCTVLVFFMQAGFCMIEAGMTRMKSSGNILLKNVIDMCIAVPIFCLVGFGFMYGNQNGFFGGFDLFTDNSYDSIIPNNIPYCVFFIFQAMFCCTATTIVSGAMAERTKFSAYCLYSIVMALLVYPITGHWIWGENGWLNDLGFHDLAGSTAVHTVGGCTALLGTIFLGPRIGKYDKKGKSRALLGSNMTIAALGVFILWFCWYGFNGGSLLGIDGITTAADGTDMWLGTLVGNVFVNTTLAAAFSTLTALLFTWFRYRKPDISMTLNAALGGLVIITAGADCISPLSAMAEGIIAGFAVVLFTEFIDKECHIDDPVGAIGVHLINGILGCILVGFLSNGQNGVEKGFFYKGGTNLLGTQVLGSICIIAWVCLVMSITFLILKKTVGLRVDATLEVEGLDKAIQGMSSMYSDFESGAFSADEYEYESIGNDPVEASIPAIMPLNTDYTGHTTTKIQIIMKESRFERFKKAMNEIGVTGMTVTHVLGCGTQKGADEYYRGIPLEMQLLPKIQVDMVVSKVPVKTVVETTRDILYTGHIGDGKIFVYNVEDVVKVRTGETGYIALQGADD